jgi:hypothetical protein
MNTRRCIYCHQQVGHAPDCVIVKMKGSQQNRTRRQEILDYLDFDTPEWADLNDK